MLNHSEIIKAMQNLDPWRFWLLWLWLMWLPALPTAAALYLVLR